MNLPLLLNVAIVAAFDERVEDGLGGNRTMLTDKAWMKVETLPDGYHLRYHHQHCFKCEWALLLMKRLFVKIFEILLTVLVILLLLLRLIDKLIVTF